MATRRPITPDPTSIASRPDSAPPTNEKSNIAPAVPTSVIVKLLSFTAAMVVAPIGSYYVTKDAWFSGNATYAGAFAAVVANVVLVAYIIVAVREDQGEMGDTAIVAKGKKAE